MMKQKILQQRLTKMSIISAAIVAALGAGAYGVYAWNDSLEQDLAKAERDVRTVQSDFSLREQKIIEADQYMGVYQELIRDDAQEKLSDLNRDKAQQWISATALEYQITNLNGNFDPVTPLNNPEFHKKTLQGITSRVTLSFGALTDEQLFRFVNAIATRFPGYVKITKVSFEKKGPINDETLLAAGRGNFPELVTGTVDFNWIAVKKPAQEQTPNAQEGQM